MFLTGKYNFLFPLLARSIYCTLFLLDCLDFAHGCICICMFHYFNYYLPDFVIAICLGFICGFSFLDICFNLTSCHNKPLVESSFLTRDQALSLWSRSTDSKTLDYQRTNPKEYQIKWELTKRKPLEYKTQHHPTTSSTLCRMPHLNNKKKQKNKNTSQIISREDYHLTQPCLSEE